MEAAQEVKDPIKPKRRRTREILESNLDEEENVPGDLDEEDLKRYYDRRYERSKEVQRVLIEKGLRFPANPTIPELIQDDSGKLIPPRNITNLSSEHLGEYHNYYTAMLAWIGHLLWVADVDRQMALSVQNEVEGFFDLQPEIQQYGHRDERTAKRNRRKTVYNAQRIAERAIATYTALERQYEMFNRLAFMISREITRREKRQHDGI